MKGEALITLPPYIAQKRQKQGGCALIGLYRAVFPCFRAEKTLFRV